MWRRSLMILIKRYGREKVLRAIKAVNAAKKTNKENAKINRINNKLDIKSPWFRLDCLGQYPIKLRINQYPNSLKVGTLGNFILFLYLI